jgi:PPM family protein phosphatase
MFPDGSGVDTSVRTSTRTSPTGPPGKRAPIESATAVLARLGMTVLSPRSPAAILPLVDCYGLSERGRRRKINEDDFRVAALPTDPHLRLNEDPSGHRLVPAPGQTGFLFLVADGMGGLPCGERASAIAVRSFQDTLMKESGFPEKGRREVLRTLHRAILQCRLDLRGEVERLPKCAGMSTTLTGLLSLGRRLYIVHSGDSRCYLFRGSTLNLVTNDHSQAQLEVDAGTRDPAAARKSPGGHSLWNCVSSGTSNMDPDVSSMLLEPGDLFLLCTDGVSDVLTAEEIRKHLASRAAAESICRSLVAMARAGVKGDDLTAVVARFGGCDVP